MFEVLITNQNKELEEQAKKAGFESVFFIDNERIVLIETGNKEDLRKRIASANAKNKKIVVMGSNDEVNRIAAEDKRVSVILHPEISRKEDFIHYRNSGLNHVLCRSMKNNGVAMGISYDSIKSLNGQKKAEAIGRIMQNIRLCRKYKTPIVLASFGKSPSSPYTLKSFGASLGMSTSQLKDSLENAKIAFSK